MLLDLMMPEVSGFDVVKDLQSHADTAGIPILVVTAKQVSAQERAALNGSAPKVIHIVEKCALNNEQFVAEVRRILRSH
jgi:DNA-binding response OmpR family regulator